ncbi:hypothetical protein FA15DRAFT_702491 [Coprinopsis marcescibilis]|uniref:Peptidase M43 pregnancy-associated plasma-A domain-containing protein n=1 Tax=Coprinopsis marcescibilis TaxID=230819 RepID=A0A5C3L3J8_COPMA|nr:hypothetical protein FA15DRAFT_702491 [Coprinopsis marcescibilis]
MKLFLFALASLAFSYGSVGGQGIDAANNDPSQIDSALETQLECLTPDASPAEAAQIEREFRASPRSNSVQRAVPLVFPLFYHVLHRDETFSGGYLSDAQVHAAVDLLNDGFAASRIRFRLDGIRRWRNATWFQSVDGSAENSAIEREMKEHTRIGGSNTLNVWTSGSLQLICHLRMTRAAGYATFPWSYATNSVNDGVVMKWDVIPGGNSVIRSGKTITHEAGHWVGLWHTFQGGCTGDGDFVGDTPAHTATDFNGCGTRDTCPDRPGEDPVYLITTKVHEVSARYGDSRAVLLFQKAGRLFIYTQLPIAPVADLASVGVNRHVETLI